MYLSQLYRLLSILHFTNDYPNFSQISTTARRSWLADKSDQAITVLYGPPTSTNRTWRIMMTQNRVVTTCRIPQQTVGKGDIQQHLINPDTMSTLISDTLVSRAEHWKFRCAIGSSIRSSGGSLWKRAKSSKTWLTKWLLRWVVHVQGGNKKNQ